MINRNSKTAVALVAGLAIGAGIYMLLTSDKKSGLGEKLRNTFKDKIDEFKDFFDNMSDEIQNRLGDQFSDAKNEFNKVAANVEDCSSEAIEALEKKLKDLKEKAAKATS